MFVLFRVRGPFTLPFHRAKTGVKRIESKHKQEFWAQPKASKYKARRGCYIFAVKHGLTYKAGYVGMATERLQGEIFTPHKLNRYNAFLAEHKNGSPVLFLVVAPTNKGKPPKSKIVAMEEDLIRLAKAVNPKLVNKIGIKDPRWGIAGVLRGGKGKVGSSAKAARQILGIASA